MRPRITVAGIRVNWYVTGFYNYYFCRYFSFTSLSHIDVSYNVHFGRYASLICFCLVKRAFASFVQRSTSMPVPTYFCAKKHSLKNWTFIHINAYIGMTRTVGLRTADVRCTKHLELYFTHRTIIQTPE